MAEESTLDPSTVTVEMTHPEAGDAANRVTLTYFRDVWAGKGWTVVPGSALDSESHAVEIPEDKPATPSRGRAAASTGSEG